MANLLRLVACLFVLLSFSVFAVDTDGDGFSDADEATLGTDPNDPTSPLENKLTASDGAAWDRFGFSISIDGDTAIIGAIGDDENGTDSGSVYVYERINNLWSEQYKLTASDGASGDLFGKSVSIDGDTAVVGASGNDNYGSVYVFLNIDGIWIEQAKLRAGDLDATLGMGSSVVSGFGTSVSIDSDTVAIGAPYGGTSNGGQAYVFIRSDGVWSQQQKITDYFEGDIYDLLGVDVFLDGDTLVIGASGDDDNDAGINSGSALIFVRSSGVWSQQQKITASDGNQNAYFGISVSIDGDIAVIGACGEENGTSSGSTYVFKRSDGIWSEQQKLIPSDGVSGDLFGNSVSIDGNTAIIGAWQRNDFRFDQGAAYVYRLNNGMWTEQEKLTAKEMQGYSALDRYYFGYAVSIDDSTAIISALGDDYAGQLTGSTYIFPITAPPHQDTPALITGAASANLDIGGFGFGTLIASDVDGLTDGSYFTISTPPANGQALINAATGNWIYTANNSYTGSDPFTVTVTDDLGGTAEQVVSITITAPDSDGDGTYDFQDNCPSVSNADQANLDGDTFGDACDNDKDGDGFTSDFDLNDLNGFYSTDPDDDGVDSSGESHYTSNVCLRAPDCNENDPCVTVCYVPPQDNCPTVSNSDQNDLDNDNLGNVCDSDADGDGLLFAFEDRLGGSDYDVNDVVFVLSNANTYFENAPADVDLDGVPDEYETAAGGDTTSSTFESVLAMLTVNKNVPAMGGIGLLALGLSMLGLGAVRLRKK